MVENYCPVCVLIAVKNDAENLARCLENLRGWADEIVVVDSQSTDNTVEVAARHGASILQFSYNGGWPKKRQWALDTYAFRNEWILVLDADEILLGPIKEEIAKAVQDSGKNGFYIPFRIVFLGRLLRFGNTQLWKLALFRKGRGRYEKRLAEQDGSMADMEIHEHVMVDGPIGRLWSPVRHENVNRLDRYIEKHNAYSNWEARVHTLDAVGEVTPRLFGTQAQRRRWLKRAFLRWPGSSVMLFVHKYILQFGIGDGIPGLIYCGFQAVQIFHVKAKMYELGLQASVLGKRG